MRELVGDIWDCYDRGGVICITTNGYVDRNGIPVMGRGTAWQAKLRFPSLPRILGNHLRKYGNVVAELLPRIVAFPVKPVEAISTGRNVVSHMRHRYKAGGLVPGWAVKADLTIISISFRALWTLLAAKGWDEVFLPRPGCGAGELSWEDVRPFCEAFGDWLVVVDRKG